MSVQINWCSDKSFSWVQDKDCSFVHNSDNLAWGDVRRLRRTCLKASTVPNRTVSRGLRKTQSCLFFSRISHMRHFCVTYKAGVQPIGRGPKPRPRILRPATKQPYAALICRLMVSTPVIHVITTHLPTPDITLDNYPQTPMQLIIAIPDSLCQNGVSPDDTWMRPSGRCRNTSLGETTWTGHRTFSPAVRLGRHKSTQPLRPAAGSRWWSIRQKRPGPGISAKWLDDITSRRRFSSEHSERSRKLYLELKIKTSNKHETVLSLTVTCLIKLEMH